MTSTRYAPMRHAARVTTWALLLLSVLLLVQSALWTGRLALPLRIAVGAVGLTAAVAPGVALVGVAALAPLGHLLVTRVWPAYPFEFAEALLLAFFAGYLVARRRDLLAGGSDDDPLARPTTAFAMVVLVGCAVQLRVLQVWHDYPLSYALESLRLLRTDYLTDTPDPRPWVDGRGFLHVPALMLEGIALMRCTRTLCASTPRLAQRLVVALTAAGTLAAALGFTDIARFADERHIGFWQAAMARRWSSPAMPSINGGGAYFMLVGFAATALALEVRRATVVAAMAALTAFSAMWLTQTRASLVAGLAIVACGAAWGAGRRLTAWSPGRLLTVAALTACAAGLFVVIANPFNVLARGGEQSLLFRWHFAETGVRMFAAAPLTGIGPGQYRNVYPYVATPAALAFAPRPNNAHNYLLWVAAELGAVGLVAFVWVLAGAAAATVGALRVSAPRHRLVLVAGLSAFLLTWSIGQPMEIPAIAITFWTMLGIAMAPGTSSHSRVPIWLRPWPARLAVSALAIVLASTLPSRLRVSTAQIDLSRVRYGFHNEGDSGRPFRWAGPRVTFHQRSTVAAVELGMAALHPSTPNGVRVRIRIDGREQAPVVLPAGEWRDIRLAPSADAWTQSRYWRVDLDVEPIDARGAPREDHRVAVSGVTAVPTWEVAR